MDAYYASGLLAAMVAPSGPTVLALVGSASKRSEVFYAMCGAGGAPADNNIRWLIRRFTAAGTGTLVTIGRRDLASPAALCTAFHSHTVEPTYTAGSGPQDLPVHQRTTWQWFYPPGTEIVIPADAVQGIGVTPSHASYNGSASATLHWRE